MVDSNSHPRSEFLLQNSVHILDSVRLADQEDAVEEGEELFANFQSPFDGCQGAVLTQTKQNGHWWVPLFTHFVLGEPVSTRHPHHPLQHRPSGNGVICTYSVHCHNRGVFVLVGTGLQNVRHALATDFDAECELVEWPTPYDLLRNGPCEQP